MKYSQMIAELNLPQINTELLSAVDVLQVLCYEVFVYFLCQGPFLLGGDQGHCVDYRDCVFQNEGGGTVGEVYFLEDFLVDGFQEDLAKLQEKFDMFSLVPAPVQEGKKQFSLIMI